MKMIIASASLAALGVVGLQAAYAPGLSANEQAKPWSVSATLRGFYDDNIATSPNQFAINSFGLEFVPGVSYYMPMDQTLFAASAKYGLKYYSDRPGNKVDQSVIADVKLDHAFSETSKLTLTDSFVLSQEPEVLYPGLYATKMRLNEDAMRNIFNILYSGKFSDQFGFEAGYNFAWYDYSENYYAWSLDRFEHLPHIDFRWQVMPELVSLIGYQFGYVDHTYGGTYGSVNPAYAGTSMANLKSSSRDEYSHYIYLGADYSFSTKFSTAIRLGGQFTTWPNVDDAPTTTQVSDSSPIPYADASATYTYLEGSFVQLGVKHTRVQTDLLALDQEATILYGVINHKFTPNITANLIGQYQRGDFYQLYTTGMGGQVSNSFADNFFVLGFNTTYQFNQYLAAEVGYNFDRLDSDIQGSSYTRNRVYIGLKATY
jgi:hypothetical protein